MESKDDMRKRGLPSPDRTDALYMTWIEPAAAQTDEASHVYGGSVTADLLGAPW